MKYSKLRKWLAVTTFFTYSFTGSSAAPSLDQVRVSDQVYELYLLQGCIQNSITAQNTYSRLNVTLAVALHTLYAQEHNCSLTAIPTTRAISLFRELSSHARTVLLWEYLDDESHALICNAPLNLPLKQRAEMPLNWYVGLALLLQEKYPENKKFNTLRHTFETLIHRSFDAHTVLADVMELRRDQKLLLYALLSTDEHTLVKKHIEQLCVTAAACHLNARNQLLL